MIDDILSFWFDEVGEAGWYKADNALDATCRSRFEGVWEDTAAGRNDGWICGPKGALALCIVLDQFPRNMFRGTAKAFSTDAKALRTAKRAIFLGHDTKLQPLQRLFLYVPLEHSEISQDQNRAVRLMALRMGGLDGYLLHARVHREVIRRFGRFPGRNDALGRTSTAGEAAFLADGGYGKLVNELKAA